jgi:hypothetical protein
MAAGMSRTNHGTAVVTCSLLTGVLVTLGRWAKGQTFNARVIIGVIGIMIFLSLVGEADQRLSLSFAAMIVVAALFTYGPDIFKKFGLIK